MQEKVLKVNNSKKFILIWDQKHIFIGTTSMLCSLARQIRCHEIMKTTGWKSIPLAMLRTLDGIDCIAVGYEIPETEEKAIETVITAIEDYYKTKNDSHSQ